MRMTATRANTATTIHPNTVPTVDTRRWRLGRLWACRRKPAAGTWLDQLADIREA
jgi:hypothetical protein